MGACGSHTVEPLPLLPSPAPDGSMVRLDLQTDPNLLKEVLDVMVKSFCGSKTAGPEGCLSWALDENGSVGGDPCNPLRDDPSAERIKTMEFIMKFCSAICLKHGCCYALVKDGYVVGATMLTPPSSRSIHALGGCSELLLAMRLGLPKAFMEGESAAKQAAIGTVMSRVHKAHAHYPHWYVYVFAVDGAKQGKGYGRELMEWVSFCADTTGHPAYLETMGPRNVRFYEKNGYEVKETAPIEYKWKGESKKCEFHGGLTVMVRQPVKK